MENLFLAYIKKVGKNTQGLFEYEFFFTETPDIVWGEDWAEQCPSSCGDLTPDESTYSTIKTLFTEIPFFCMQDNSCFSCQDAIDGIIALGFENISEYEEYPTPIRLVFPFGDSYENVVEKLNQRDCKFEEDSEEE